MSVTRSHPSTFQGVPPLQVIPAEAGIQMTVDKQPAVYILASRPNGTLYIGVTSDLPKRVWEHKNDVVEGFTIKYRVHRLVYFECHEDMDNAIVREHRMKAWKREWKIRLIEETNPAWDDLYDQIAVER